MKKNMLFTALLSVSGLYAQINPSQVESPLEINIFEKDFPGLRSGFTQLKVLTPAVNGSSYSTWFNFNIGRENNIVSSTGFSDVDPANPLEDELRSTGTKTGNTYVSLVEMNDQGTWTAYERITGYFDQGGKDSLWMIESHNGTTYTEDSRIEMKYNGSGNFTGYHVYEFDGNDWTLAGIRSIGFSGPERSSDSIYTVQDGDLFPIMFKEYVYKNGKVDSITTHTFSIQDMDFKFNSAFKITNGTDGGIDRILTYSITNDGKDSIFVESRTDVLSPVTGLKDIDPEQFSIYPVPATDILHINVKNGKTYTAELFDIQGRKLFTGEISAASTLNVAELNNGLYILVLQGSDGEKLQKRMMIGK